jgi:hypothetical protein
LAIKKSKKKQDFIKMKLNFFDIFSDPFKQTIYLISIIVNIMFIFGIWKIGLSIIFLLILINVIIIYFNSQIVIKPSKDLSILITGTSTGIGKVSIFINQF